MVKLEAGRNLVIDAYRGVLIYSVIVFHYLVFWAPPFQNQNLYGYSDFYPDLLAAGHFGVHIFFVISGLVISMTLMRSRNTAAFAWKRFTRLAPSLIVCCTISFLATKLVSIPEFERTLRDLILSFTLMPEKLSARPIDGSYWSLGTEFRFYIWVALFYSILGNRFWTGMCGLGVLAIIQDASGLSFTSYYLIGAYIHFFLIGIAFWYSIYERKAMPAIFCFAIGIILYGIRYKSISVNGHHVVVTNILVIGATLLLWLAIRFRLFGSSKVVALLAYVGSYSYPLYLLHQTIGVIIINRLKVEAGCSDLLALCSALIVVNVLAILVHYLVEIPAQTALRHVSAVRRSKRPSDNNLSLETRL